MLTGGKNIEVQTYGNGADRKAGFLTK